MAAEQNTIIDYVSGISVPATPEEINATQVYSRILCEDYGYPKDFLQTRPQYRVKASPSDKSGYPIDIAVFDEIDGNRQLKMIVECKRPERKDGIDQLQDYLTFSGAEIGIWFNGSSSAYIKKNIVDGKVLYEEIPAIPRFGEQLYEVGKYRREDLISTHNLKGIFNEIRGYIVGNAVGVNRDEQIAKEMIHLILCKIYDERFTAPSDMVKFRASTDEDAATVNNRIQELFGAVKAKYSDVLTSADEITFDGETLKHIIGKLQIFCFIETERDIIADAFEVFIGESLKGEQGQFFTPKNIGQLLVAAANPTTDEVIIDTAAGSGLFLVESLKHLWGQLEETAQKYNWSDSALAEEKKEVGIRCIRGLEKDSFLAKLSKSYMAILGDGRGGIFCEDSLNNPKDWSQKTQQKIGFNQANVCITNPPFGKNIKVTGEEKLAQFKLAKKEDDKLVKEGNPSILFLERDLQLLTEGGRLAIILPETYFHAPTKKNIRDFIRQHNIQYIFDLDHNTFRPHCNAKCIAIVLQKNTPQQSEIIMGVLNNVGHDHTGKPIVQINAETHKEEIVDDTPGVIEAIKNLQQGKEENSDLVFKVKAETVLDKDIFVPRYYWQEQTQLMLKEAAKLGFDMLPLSDLIQSDALKFFDGHGSPKTEFKGRGNIPYVRVKDIVLWQIYKDPTALVSEDVYSEFYRPEKELHPKDILFVRRGSYRIGSVSMVSPYDTKCILTREILVLRLSEKNRWNITPEYLLYALSHQLVFEQIKNKVFIDTTLPNIGERWKELYVPIFKDKKKQDEITEYMREITQSQWSAQKEISRLREQCGIYNT